MNVQGLIDVARKLVADDKGLLAMDESNPTCNKRFASLGISQTEEARRAYRELIVTTPALGECISGVILYDETIHQQKKDGTPFVKVITDAGIILGIKVDIGAKDMAGHSGEKITEGLDGLRERLAEYSGMGARFAKWRAVIALGDGLPSRGCIEANAQALARYAALCQEVGLVPIVEPEVLMDGQHTLQRCGDVSEEVLRSVFNQLCRQQVMLEGMLLKPNMVLPGLSCPHQESVDETADATVKCLLRVVPAAVPGTYSVGDDLFLFHVGDSRAYLYRGGRLRRLTHDHTVAQALADTGQIGAEEFASHRMRHVLTNVMGSQTGQLHVEMLQVRLLDGDRVLLCTDGLTEMVHEDEILEILRGIEDSGQACRAVVDKALQHGGKDNVTVLIARYHIPKHVATGVSGDRNG